MSFDAKVLLLAQVQTSQKKGKARRTVKVRPADNKRTERRQQYYASLQMGR